MVQNWNEVIIFIALQCFGQHAWYHRIMTDHYTSCKISGPQHRK